MTPKEFSMAIDGAIRELRELKREGEEFIQSIRNAADACQGDPDNCPVKELLP